MDNNSEFGISRYIVDPKDYEKEMKKFRKSLPKLSELKKMMKPFPKDKNKITAREKDVLYLIAKGYTNAEIANELCISFYTAKVHVRNIIKKLDAYDRQQAVIFAMRKNIISIPYSQSE